MLADAEDHYARMLEFMVPKADLLFLTDAMPGEAADDDEEPPMIPVPLGEGVLPRTAVMEAINTRLPDDAPVVVAPRDLPTATAWRHGAAR